MEAKLTCNTATGGQVIRLHPSTANVFSLHRTMIGLPTVVTIHKDMSVKVSMYCWSCFRFMWVTV